MDVYSSVSALLATCRPENPVLALRPHMARRAASWFVETFPGEVVYAFKANSTLPLVDELHAAGVSAFDVASLEEIARISERYPGSVLHHMNPVKSRHAIREAYHRFGVRSFALDSFDELRKILHETGHADDLKLSVRLATPGSHALIPLDTKYGARDEVAVGLLREVRQHARELGVTFHVGSQMMVPDAFGVMLEHVGELIVEAGVLVDWLDVGGGFPCAYPGMTPPPMQSFIDAISAGIAKLALPDTCRIACEPGRALVAEAEALVVRIDGRRGQELFINDGAYGCLFDAGHSDLTFPVRPGQPERFEDVALVPFSLWGPTCDSIDRMPGPFLLPETIGEGDYIEIGNVGAYGRVLANRFNGFGHYDEVKLTDAPMMSVWSETLGEAQVEADVAMPKVG